SVCPTCRRPMDGQHKVRLRQDFVARGTRLRDQFRAHERVCRELDATVSASEQELARLATALDGRTAVQRRLAQAEARVTQAEQARRELATLQGDLADRQRVLRDETF